MTEFSLSNITAKAKQLSGGNTVHEQQLIMFAKVCVKPAYRYFKQKFDNDLQHLMGAFIAAQFFGLPEFLLFNRQLLILTHLIVFLSLTLVKWMSLSLLHERH